jgi:outer membrane protein insertion porin family
LKTEYDISGFNSQAEVERIHVEGLGRTKDDLIVETVKDLFSVKDFQAVVLKANEIRTQLEKLGCFRSVSVLIDTSKQPNASPSGLEITYTVEELNRLSGGINTQIGNNEGSVVIGSKLPNLFGRGEKLQAEYTYGTKQSKGFNGTFIKPLHNKANTM